MNLPVAARRRRILWCVAFLAALLVLGSAWSGPAERARPPAAPAPPSADLGFSFAVATDMRNYAGPGEYDTASYFRGAMLALDALDPVAFVLSPGDLDPVPGVLWTITGTLGAGAAWVPVIGNHELPGQGQEAESGANLNGLRAFDGGAEHAGPAACPTTTFSFDRGPAHFVVLNE
jgi:hypothetical protein